MNTEEHLNLIVAYCQRCLEIAEKRTQGKWELKMRGWDGSFIYGLEFGTKRRLIAEVSLDYDTSTPNAQFIATCAGAAEAGWRATILSIDHFKLVISSYSHNTGGYTIAKDGLLEILTAYPIELITQ